MGDSKTAMPRRQEVTFSKTVRIAVLVSVVLAFAAAGITAAETRNLGNGFRDHGVAVPISNQRGAAAAGNIWTVTYPQCGVLSFNPKTRELKDYGEVYKQNWPQYPRSGTPAYGRTGGGLFFWDKEKRAATVLRDADVVPDESTLSMIALPGGRMLAGTTISPGTGGEKKAAEAVLYVMDLTTRKIEWQAAVLPGVQQYTDLLAGPKGLVYGIADRKLFFIFDTVKRTVVAKQDVEAELGRAAYHQGPRVFVVGPKGRVYALFSKGIARLDAKSNTLKLVAQSPLPIGTGGDYFKGRIYFSSGSHLLSYQPD